MNRDTTQHIRWFGFRECQRRPWSHVNRLPPAPPPARAAPRLLPRAQRRVSAPSRAPRRARRGSAACPEIRRGQPTLAGSDHDRRM